MNDFDKLIQDIEDEARAEGPEAVAQLARFDSQFSLAADLMSLRKSEGLTQEALAERSGIQQAEISKIERGVVNPTVGTLSKIAGALGAHVRLVQDPTPEPALPS